MTVPATEIAMAHIGRPVPNAVLLGGFAALTGQVILAGVQAALLERFPGAMGEANAAAAEEAHREVLARMAGQRWREDEHAISD